MLAPPTPGKDGEEPAGGRTFSRLGALDVRNHATHDTIRVLEEYLGDIVENLLVEHTGADSVPSLCIDPLYAGDERGSGRSLAVLAQKCACRRKDDRWIGVRTALADEVQGHVNPRVAKAVNYSLYYHKL